MDEELAGPKKKYNQEGNKKISEITIPFAHMYILKIALLCFHADLNRLPKKIIRP